MGIKASKLSEENNKLYAIINTYNNTLIPAFNMLLQSFNISEPVTIEQIHALTVKQRGVLFAGLADIIKAIGVEVGERTLEDTLLDIGYTDIDAAIVDVSNIFTGETAITVTNTLTRIKNTLTILDALIEPTLLLDILLNIESIKDSVVSDAASLGTV